MPLFTVIAAGIAGGHVCDLEQQKSCRYRTQVTIFDIAIIIKIAFPNQI